MGEAHLRFERSLFALLGESARVRSHTAHRFLLQYLEVR
jgi:hypothetical protein